MQHYTEKKLEQERLVKEFRESKKYGYKIVEARFLVKLSFPEDAELVNVNEDKSRADKAFVESVKLLKEFDGGGVTNYDYSIANYRVGEEIYPDYFDDDVNNKCGHGIHFCVDPEYLERHFSLKSEEKNLIREYVK